MPVEKIKYTYLIVDDMDAAVSFYQNVIGLRLKFQDGGRWAEFDAGHGTSLALSSPEESGLSVSGPVIVFHADDIDPMRAALADSGASIVATRDMGSHGRLVAVRDPSGNVFQLMDKHPVEG